MADYVTKYTFHIDERKRPEGFPREVYIIDDFEDIEGDKQIAEIYNRQFKQFVYAPGIVVFLNQNDIDSRGIDFSKRVFIPWHMITHSHGEVKLMVKEEPKTNLDAMIPEPLPAPENKKVAIQ